MTQKDEEGEFVKVVGVIAGPIFSGDIFSDDEDFDAPDEEDCWIMQLQIQNDYGAIEVEDFEFDTFEEAYEIVEHFFEAKTFKPYWLDVEDPNED